LAFVSARLPILAARKVVSLLKHERINFWKESLSSLIVEVSSLLLDADLESNNGH